MSHDPSESKSHPDEQQHKHAKGRTPKVVYRAGMTPFARVLIDYTWDQRPNISIPELAQRIGMLRQTVSTWIYKGSEPELPMIFRVLATLNIPIRKLVAAYIEEDMPLPSDLREWASETPPPTSPNQG